MRQTKTGHLRARLLNSNGEPLALRLVTGEAHLVGIPLVIAGERLDAAGVVTGKALTLKISDVMRDARSAGCAAGVPAGSAGVTRGNRLVALKTRVAGAANVIGWIGLDTAFTMAQHTIITAFQRMWNGGNATRRRSSRGCGRLRRCPLGGCSCLRCCGGVRRRGCFWRGGRRFCRSGHMTHLALVHCPSFVIGRVWLQAARSMTRQAVIAAVQ